MRYATTRVDKPPTGNAALHRRDRLAEKDVIGGMW